MAFDLHLLTKLSYDEAEPLLEQYIQDVLEQFVQSKTGQAHCTQYPTGGFWIGTFVEFAYLYSEITLPKMTKRDVQQLMEVILPRKLTLMNSNDADDAIIELVAFWTFLKDNYRLRSAGAIIKYLQSIELEFKAWMTDSTRGGFAKNFLMAGQGSGFDMTSETDIQAFQEIYNQNIGNDNVINFPGATKVPMIAPPPEVQEFLDLMGIDLPPAGEMVDPMSVMGPVIQAMGQLETVMAEMEDSPPMQANPNQTTRSMMLGKMSTEIVLTEADIKVLNAQTISETSPGTVLQEIETLLEFVGESGIPVSAKRQQIGGQYLRDLNDKLINSVEVNLKRPTQKSYPFIHGLYLLLRASRLVSIVPKGKKLQMCLNQRTFAAWEALNPTERYFTLLEAWIIQSHGEILGDERDYLTEGDRMLKAWGYQLGQKVTTYSNYGKQDVLAFWPGFHNLALMHLFGFMAVISGKPTKGKGWRIKKTEPLPWGVAMINLIQRTYMQQSFTWKSEQDTSLVFKELQPVISKYFPDWKQCLTVPQRAFRPGRYIFKISLGKIWRRIAINAEAMLADLSELILDSVEFDNDHLDEFSFKDDWGRTIRVVHPWADAELSTEEFLIGDLPLEVGDAMRYLFDFGDNWRFSVKLEAIHPVTHPQRRKRKKSALGEILESHGKSPEQYPDYDES